MNEKARRSLFSFYSVISGTVTHNYLNFATNSYWCPDYNSLMDTGYKNDAHMYIATDNSY